MDKSDDTKSDWLYRYGGHVYGPVEEARLIELIMGGAVPGELEVARDGEEFHPASRVLRFQATVAKATDLHGGKEAGRYRTMGRVVLLLGTCCVLGSLGAVFLATDALLAQHDAALVDARGRLEKAGKVQELPRLALTAIPAKAASAAKRGEGARASGEKRLPRRRPVKTPDAEAEDDSMVATCERSNDEIRKVVERHVGKINTCIVEGRERGDGEPLEGVLTVGFVVRPTGSLVEFELRSSEYSHPMLNCLTRVFTRIRFARTGGTNCPVSLPITIGD